MIAHNEKNPWAAPTVPGDSSNHEGAHSVPSVGQPTRVGEYLTQFAMRMMQDALDSASASFWRRRAENFENARPKVGEFHGSAGADELRRRDEFCRDTALACRRHADLLESMMPNPVSDEVKDVYGEVA